MIHSHEICITISANIARYMNEQNHFSQVSLTRGAIGRSLCQASVCHLFVFACVCVSAFNIFHHSRIYVWRGSSQHSRYFDTVEISNKMRSSVYTQSSLRCEFLSFRLVKWLVCFDLISFLSYTFQLNLNCFQRNYPNSLSTINCSSNCNGIYSSDTDTDTLHT